MKKLFILFSFSAIAAIISLAPPLPSRAQTLGERVEALEKKAAEGDAEAMYHLSTLYEPGFDSIAADSLRSRRFLKASAEGGYAPAQNYYGFLIYPSYKDAGLSWLAKAADQGDIKAVSNLGFLLLQPDSTINDEQRAEHDLKAAQLLSKAAQADLPAAMATLADLYREGRGVEQDSLEAERLYLGAVARGLPDAERKLLDMNFQRYQTLSPDSALAEGVRASRAGAYTVAFNLYSRAAEGEIPKAFALLGDAYSSAKGTDYNHDLAIRNYYSGAVGGDPSAQFILAELLEIFPDALKDIASEEAPSEYASPDFWYEKASSAGVTSARDAFHRLFD